MNFNVLRTVGIVLIAFGSFAIASTTRGASVQQTALAAAIGIAIYMFVLTVLEFSQAVVETGRKKQIVTTTLQRAEAFKDSVLDANNEAIRRRERVRELETLFLRVSGQKSGDKVVDIRRKMLQAGYRSPSAVIIYALAKIITPFIGVLAGYYLGSLYFPEDTLMLMACLATGGLVGSMGVDNYLQGKAKKRLGRIEDEFPSYLELLLICIRSGMSIDRAVDQVNQEITISGEQNAVVEEFEAFSIDLKTVSDRVKAYENLEKRAPTQSLSGFCLLMTQSERYGTPIAKSMADLASDVRRSTLIRAETKAAKLPILMLFPMVVFIVLPLLMIIMGPAAMGILDAFK